MHSLQRPQEIQQILLLLRGELVVETDDCVGFRATAGVLLNGMNQPAVGRSGASIMQKKDTLTETPKGSGAEFVRARAALADVVRQSSSHVMDEQVGEERGSLVGKTGREAGRRGRKRRCVARVAVNLAEDGLSILNGAGWRVAGNTC